MTRRHGAVERRYAVPVGIGVRVAQLFRNTPLEVLGDEMFEPFCFVVQFFDWVTEHGEQEGLNKPMVPHNLKRVPPA